MNKPETKFCSFSKFNAMIEQWEENGKSDAVVNRLDFERISSKLIQHSFNMVLLSWLKREK